MRVTRSLANEVSVFSARHSRLEGIHYDSIAKCETVELVREETVPITEANPFKGRQYPGQVIVTAVRWYLRYPLAYEHVSELLRPSADFQWMAAASGAGCKPTRRS